MARTSIAIAQRTSRRDADWLQALGHPHRVDILRHMLATGTATPSDLAELLSCPLGTASYHVRALAHRGIVRLAGRTQRRGASVHHYQLADRERVASVLWGMTARLLVTDIARDHDRSDATVTLDPEALDELQALTDDYIARLGELGLQTRERRGADESRDDPALTRVAVLLATEPDA